MAEEGLEFEYRKKFQGIEFRDIHDLINKVAESGEVEISSAEVSIDKPFVCKGLVKVDNNCTKIPDAKFATRETKAYTFDLTRAEAIFDLLLTEKKGQHRTADKNPAEKDAETSSAGQDTNSPGRGIETPKEDGDRRRATIRANRSPYSIKPPRTWRPRQDGYPHRMTAVSVEPKAAALEKTDEGIIDVYHGRDPPFSANGLSFLMEFHKDHSPIDLYSMTP
ncbi:unnamed protein product [Prunus armeniaca]